MLVLQNSALCLTMRYSRAVLKEQYLTSTTIVLNECVKLVFSISMLLLGFKLRAPIRANGLVRHLASILFCRECLLMAVPGFLYFIMNQLAFVGLENLEASTYSLVSQLKILTTAVFARVLLQKKLWWFQWRALLLLVIGVVLVQAQPGKPQQSTVTMPNLSSNGGVLEIAGPALTNDLTHLSRSNATLVEVAPGGRRLMLSETGDVVEGIHPLDAAPLTAPIAAIPPATPAAKSSFFVQSKGLLATGMAAVLSGLSGCYVEKMMKGGTLSVWDRNVQLAVYGIVFGLGQIVFFSSDADRNYASINGWLGGYSALACVVVLLNSLGGILVSLVVVYLDNIIRGFATSVAILLTAFVSFVAFHDVQITTVFACGVVTVLLSVLNYQDTMMATPLEMASMVSGPTTIPNTAQPPTPKEDKDGASSGGVPGATNSTGVVELQGVSVHRFLAALEGESGNETTIHNGMTRSRSALQVGSPRDEDEKAGLLRG